MTRIDVERRNCQKMLVSIIVLLIQVSFAFQVHKTRETHVTTFLHSAVNLTTVRWNLSTCIFIIVK